MTNIRQTIRGLRGESFADVARRVGSIGGATVPSTSTDAEVMDLLVSGVASEAVNEIADATSDGLVAIADATTDGLNDIAGASSAALAGINSAKTAALTEIDAQKNAVQILHDETLAARDTVNASITPIMYGIGAPDAMTGGPDGATFIDVSSGRQYGPKAAGVWPSRFVQLANPGTGPEPVTVVFMLGQSNADGWATDYSGATALSPGYGYEYYYDEGGFGAVLPLGPNRLGRTTGGPQSAFAQAWAAGGGGACVFVDCAVGGSSMYAPAKTALTGAPNIANLSGGTWDLSDPANLYVNYIRDHMRFALTEIARLGFKVQHKVLYFSQGEQDALGNVSQANYEASLRAFATQLRSDFPEVWWLTENLGHNQANSTPSQHAAIRAGQAAVAADTAYSKWMTIACTLAQTFVSTDFSDTLHYNQNGYNQLGSTMASNGLTFTRASSTLAVPDGTKYADLLAHMPPVYGWYRTKFTTNVNGAFAISLFNDPITPYAATWYDTTGVNRVDAAQSLAWTFPSGASKDIYLYIHKSTGTTVQLGPVTAGSLTGMSVIDQGVPVATVNLTGGFAAGSGVADKDLYRMSAGVARSLLLSTTTGMTGHSFTNTALARLSGLTQLNIDRCPLVPTLNLALVPNLTSHTQQRSGLSVAEVNARLVALDANGKSNGNVNLMQFLSGTYPVSPPSGAGLTAKTSLQGKGWTVTTD